MSFILYHLATNAAKQEKLYREIQQVLPNGQTPINVGALANLKYLKATVKEAMRLNPVSIGVGRILPEDGSFSGYFVPKDVMQNITHTLLPPLSPPLKDALNEIVLFADYTCESEPSFIEIGMLLRESARVYSGTVDQRQRRLQEISSLFSVTIWPRSSSMYC